MRVVAAVLWVVSTLALCCCDSADKKPGTERGPCYGNGTCNDGLTCLSDLCVRLTDGGSPSDSRPESDGQRLPCSWLSFDGVASYVQVPHATELSPGKGDFTVEAWVKASNKDAMLVSKCREGNCYWVEVNNIASTSPANLWFVTPAGWVVFAAKNQGTVENWTHVAVQRKAGSVEMYLNGKRAQVTTIPNSGSTNPSDHDVSNDDPLQIGRQPKGQFLKGAISELRVTNTAVYSSDFTPPEALEALAQTMLLYHFDESRGTKLTDASGKGNHGTVYNATWGTEKNPCQ